jgi:hypothetical protein
MKNKEKGTIFMLYTTKLLNGTQKISKTMQEFHVKTQNQVEYYPPNNFQN